MHRDEVAALNRDFDYVLAAIASLERRVSDLDGKPTTSIAVVTGKPGPSSERVLSK